MYNPFIIGDHPVGVRTIVLAGNENNYTTEVWYPAADEYRGVEAVDRFKYVDELPAATQEAIRGAKPRDDKRSLVIYWHGGYGHRREMAAMCILLASRGFVVASPDFPGDNVRDTFGPDPELAKRSIDDSAAARPAQAAEIVELLLNDESASQIIDEPAGVGCFGMSMGGFTTLAVNSESARIKACLAICPMTGTRSMVPGVVRLSHLLRTDDWKSTPSTFVLTGSEDCFVIADDVRDLFKRIDHPKRLAVLKGAGHIHWVDNAEFVHETMRARYASGEFPDPDLDTAKLAKLMRPFSELCPASHAADSMRAIAVAQFEANLKEDDDARVFLGRNLATTFATRGIDLEVSEDVPSYDPLAGVSIRLA
jgi:dienelactone hydrolase